MEAKSLYVIEKKNENDNGHKLLEEIEHAHKSECECE